MENYSNKNMTNIDPKTAAIVKALAYTENGGKPNPSNTKAGKTGEMKSIFQFTPDTWKIYSKQVSGEENLPLTPENESMVVYGKVNKWLQEGYDVNQIASMWNAGEQRPDAYKQNFKGVNKKYGVAYDTPKYAKEVASYAQKFEKEGQPLAGSSDETQGNAGLLASASQTQNNPGMINNSNQSAPETTPGLLAPSMKQVRQA